MQVKNSQIMADHDITPISVRVVLANLETPRKVGKHFHMRRLMPPPPPPTFKTIPSALRAGWLIIIFSLSFLISFIYYRSLEKKTKHERSNFSYLNKVKICFHKNERALNYKKVLTNLIYR